MEALLETSGPKMFGSDHQRIFRPLCNRGSRAFGNLEPNRLLSFALQDRCPLFDLPGGHHIDDFHADKITTAKFAVDSHVEQGKVAMVLSQLKPHADRPDMFGFEWSLLADDASLVPGGAKCANGW